MTDLFDSLGPPLLVREGGGAYTNRPSDAGGPTRWGVTAKTLGDWLKLGRPATPAEVQALTQAEALLIYRTEFWTDPGFDKVAAVSAKIGAELFDTGVNMGVGTASTWLQRALNVLNRQQRDYPDVPVTGHVGPLTLDALKALLARRGALGETVLLRALNCLQGEQYIALAERRASDEDNVFGWLANRIGLA